MPEKLSQNEEADNLPTFSKRQIEVIRQWADTKSASEAALNLGIAEQTYQTHLKRMRVKIKVNRTFNVYRHLMERGLL